MLGSQFPRSGGANRRIRSAIAKLEQPSLMGCDRSPERLKGNAMKIVIEYCGK